MDCTTLAERIKSLKEQYENLHKAYEEGVAHGKIKMAFEYRSKETAQRIDDIIEEYREEIYDKNPEIIALEAPQPIIRNASSVVHNKLGEIYYIEQQDKISVYESGQHYSTSAPNIEQFFGCLDNHCILYKVKNQRGLKIAEEQSNGGWNIANEIFLGNIVDSNSIVASLYPHNSSEMLIGNDTILQSAIKSNGKWVAGKQIKGLSQKAPISAIVPQKDKTVVIEQGDSLYQIKKVQDIWKTEKLTTKQSKTRAISPDCQIFEYDESSNEIYLTSKEDGKWTTNKTNIETKAKVKDILPIDSQNVATIDENNVIKIWSYQDDTKQWQPYKTYAGLTTSGKYQVESLFKTNDLNKFESLCIEMKNVIDGKKNLFRFDIAISEKDNIPSTDELVSILARKAQA